MNRRNYISRKLGSNSTSKNCNKTLRTKGRSEEKSGKRKEIDRMIDLTKYIDSKKRVTYVNNDADETNKWNDPDTKAKLLEKCTSKIKKEKTPKNVTDPFFDDSFEGIKRTKSKNKVKISTRNPEEIVTYTLHNPKTIKSNFNAATDIVAERIVNKQLELGRLGNKPATTVKPSRIPVKLIAQRILETDTELARTQRKYHLGDRSNSDLKKKVVVLIEPDNKTSSNELKKTRSKMKSKPLEFRSRPRFHLSVKRSGSRVKISNTAIQTKLGTDSWPTLGTQTNFVTPVRNRIVQAKRNFNTGTKKQQTRSWKKVSVKTSPMLIEGPSKYTNTETNYPCSDQFTQNYEYVSSSDMFCLEWVNKHLFAVKWDPNNFIMDEKIRDLSEMVTKSSLFTLAGP